MNDIQGNNGYVESEEAEKRNADESWAFQPITELEPEAPLSWTWEGYISPGHLTILGAPIKTGKTTLLTSFFRAICNGSDNFLGQRLEPTKVGIVTEESRSIWCQRRDTSGLNDQIVVCSRPNLVKGNMPSWHEFCDNLLNQVAKHDLNLLMLDTLSRIWPVMEENLAGPVDQAMDSLSPLLRAGIPVIAVMHHNKGENANLLTSLRGNSAIAGAADIILGLSLPSNRKEEDGIRILEAVGRQPDIPARLEIQWDGNDYRVCGKSRDWKLRQYEDRILRALPNSKLDAMSRSEVIAKAGVSKKVGLQVIMEMLNRRYIGQEGDGKASKIWRLIELEP